MFNLDFLNLFLKRTLHISSVQVVAKLILIAERMLISWIVGGYAIKRQYEKNYITINLQLSSNIVSFNGEGPNMMGFFKYISSFIQQITQFITCLI